MSILRFVKSIFSLLLAVSKALGQVDPVSGRILIDGIDISKIGIHDLRSRLVCLKPSHCVASPLISIYQTFIPQVSDVTPL
jgi:hypothetical protein